MGVRIDENHLSCYTGIVEGNKFYTVDVLYGLLLEYSMEDYSHCILTQMDCINVNKGQYFVRKIIKVEEIFYFFMGNSLDIIKWSLTDHEFQIIKSDPHSDLRYYKTENAFRLKNKIWICPACSDQPFRCFDILSEEITEYASVKEQIRKLGITLDESQFIFTLFEGGKLWVAIYNSQYVVTYDVNKNRWDCHSFHEFGKVSKICFDGNDLWVYFMYNKVFVSWTPEQGIIDTFEVSDINLDMEAGDPFLYIYGAQDYIYVIPTYNNDIHIVQRKTKKVYSAGFSKRYNRTDKRLFVPLFYTYLRDENRLILLPYSVDTIVVIDIKRGHIQYINAQMNQNDKYFYLNHCWSQRVMMEDRELRLREYLSYIVFRDKENGKQEKREVYGQVIEREIVK